MSLTVTTSRKKSFDDATKTEALLTGDSHLGSYYRWLLCDPTHKDYWAARTTDREARGRPPDKETS